MANEPLDMGKWKGLFEWSMKYQDGTREGGAPQPLDPEKKAWLEQALQEFMKDFADRMKEINASLAADSSSSAADGGDNNSSSGGTSLADKEALCDELMEIVENVDYARDLHKIGGLPTLLSLLSSPHPSLRWRAAEIAATCMANNPPVQRWFMEGGALPPLLALLADSHPVVVTKALLALSALVRHYEPGLEAFRLGGGLNKLLALMGCPTDPAIQQAGAAGPAPAAAAATSQPQQQHEDADEQQQQQRQRRLHRKVLALLQYVLAKHPADGFAAAEFGLVPQLQALLGEESDSDMRCAALAVLAQVVGDPQGWQWVRQHQAGWLPCLQQQLLQKLLGVLQSDSPPQGGAAGLRDHIELDPTQDGPDRSAPHTLELGGKNAAASGHQPSQQQSQPVSAESAAWALTAVPKQELR